MVREIETSPLEIVTAYIHNVNERGNGFGTITGPADKLDNVVYINRTEARKWGIQQGHTYELHVVPNNHPHIQWKAVEPPEQLVGTPVQESIQKQLGVIEDHLDSHGFATGKQLAKALGNENMAVADLARAAVANGSAVRIEVKNAEGGTIRVWYAHRAAEVDSLLQEYRDQPHELRPVLGKRQKELG